MKSYFSKNIRITMIHRRFIVIGVAVFILGLSISANANPVYSFTSFDGPGNNGGGTTVNGIDNNNDLIGFSSDNAATPTLFTNFIRNANGTLTTLAIGGDPLAMSNGINNSHTVVGTSSNGTAFSLSGSTYATRPNVNGSTVSESAFGINDGGLIVGQYTDGTTGTTLGFLFNGSAFTTLNPVLNASVTNAQGVNNNGMVAGFYSTDGVHQHGFFYNSGTDQFTFPADPTISNLVLTQFLGINDNGLAVGYYQLLDGSQHGFLFNTMTHVYSFLDDPNAALNGLSITQITGVNDSGEITGFYVDATTGLQRGFYATPEAATVPESGSFGLLLSGLVLALVTDRSFRRHLNRDKE